MAKNNNIKKKKGTGSKRLKPPSTNNEVVLPEKQAPIFSLEHLQPDYCITDCQMRDQAQFAIRLRKFSEMTWAQIKAADRHGLGQEKIERGAINAPIPAHLTEDVDFLALRFSGKKPMIGYRINRIFYIVWLDNDFTVYDHGS